MGICIVWVNDRNTFCLQPEFNSAQFKDAIADNWKNIYCSDAKVNTLAIIELDLIPTVCHKVSAKCTKLWNGYTFFGGIGKNQFILQYYTLTAQVLIEPIHQCHLLLCNSTGAKVVRIERRKAVGFN